MPVPFDPLPTTLEEAVDQIFNNLTDDEKRHFTDEASFAWMHHSLGRALRNEWGLWGGSTLKEHFQERFKLGHADDMSGIILDSVRSRINRTPFNLEKEVAYYRAYWPDNYGIDALTQQPIPGHPKSRQ